MSVFGTQTPQVEGDAYNTLAFVIQQMLSKVNTCCVVRVVACSNSGGVVPVGTVDVQPLVNQMTGDRLAIPHGTIFKLPYMRIQGGTNAIILDPQAGDIGVVVFSQRDITSVKAAKGQANPGSFRQFNWADGIYVGGILNGTPQQYLQFTDAGIFLTSPTVLTLTAPEIMLDGDVTTSGIAIFEETVLVTGETTLTGGFTAPAGAVAALEVSSISPIGGGTFPTPTFPVAVTDSISGDGVATPLALTGDTATPGNSMYYGTNSSGVKGWYVLTGGGGGGGTVTSVGISVSSFLSVGGTNPVTGAGTITLDLSVAFQAALAATAALAASAVQTVHTSDSITGAGSSGSPLALVGDAATPGNSMYYGTNGAGSKGWFTLPASGTGTVTSVAAGSADVVIGGTPTVAPTVDLSSAVKADLALAASAVQPGAIQFIESAGWNANSGTGPIVIVIAATMPQDMQIPYGCTLKDVRIQTQGGTGSCTVTLAVSTFPFVSGTDITGGVPPAISSGTSYDNSTLTSWTTAFAQGAMIRATLTANLGFTSVKLMMRFS